MERLEQLERLETLIYSEQRTTQPSQCDLVKLPFTFPLFPRAPTQEVRLRAIDRFVAHHHDQGDAWNAVERDQIGIENLRQRFPPPSPGCRIALSGKIQGARGIGTEYLPTLGFAKIQLLNLSHRLEVPHRHRIIGTDNHAIRADDLNQIL